MYIHNQIHIRKHPFEQVYTQRQRVLKELKEQQTEEDQKFSDNTDDYYTIQHVHNFGKQKKKKQNSFIMEQIKCEKLEKGSTKKQKDSKLYLEFLKCYWKKDYQQLAQKYQRNHQNYEDELPFLVTSYTKGTNITPKIIQSTKAEKSAGNSVKPSRQSVNQSCSKKYIQIQNNISIDPYLTKKDGDQHEQHEQKTLESIDKVQGYTIKCDNLKMNLKKNAQKNLDQLLQSSNIFYHQYPQSYPFKGINSQAGSRQSSKGKQQKLTRNGSQSYLKTNGFDKKLQKVVETEFEIEKKTNFDNQKDLEVFDIKFNYLILTRINLIYRINQPQNILILYPEEVFGFHKFSFFGFSHAIYEEELFKQLNESIESNFQKINYDEDYNKFNNYYIFNDLKNLFQQIKKKYLVIFIIHQESKIKNQLLSYIQKNSIFHDGIYSVNSQTLESYNLVVDYKVIFQDFKVNVLQQVIIVSSLQDQSTKIEPQKNFITKSISQGLGYFQEIQLLKNTYLQSLDGLKSIFPLTELQNIHNYKIILFPRIQYQDLIYLVKHKIDIKELQNIKKLVFALQHQGMIFNILSQQPLYRINIRKTILQESENLRRNFILRQNNLEKQNSIQQFLEKKIVDDYEENYKENKRKLNQEMQQFVTKGLKKNKVKKFKFNPDEQYDEVNQKICQLFDELFMKNRQIHKSIMEFRNELCERKIKKEVQGLKRKEIEELEYLNKFNELILFCSYKSYYNQ